MILPAADTPWSDNVMLKTITSNTASEERECLDTRDTLFAGEEDDAVEQVWLRFHDIGSINFLLTSSSQQLAQQVISIITQAMRYDI